MSEVDVGFFDEAIELLRLKRERQPVETEQFLIEVKLDGLAELEATDDGRVILWPSRRLLEFLGLEDRRAS